jgi:hypothetical protein
MKTRDGTRRSPSTEKKQHTSARNLFTRACHGRQKIDLRDYLARSEVSIRYNTPPYFVGIDYSL